MRGQTCNSISFVISICLRINGESTFEMTCVYIYIEEGCHSPNTQGTYCINVN